MNGFNGLKSDKFVRSAPYLAADYADSLDFGRGTALPWPVKSEGLTHTIIGAAMEVHNSLGPGFLESLYRNALLHELRLRGVQTKAELEVQVAYKDLVIGRHRLDLVVENEVIVELKAIAGIAGIHIAQTLSYMKAMSAEVGLIVNFGEDSLSWKRLIKKARIPRI